MTYAFEWKGEGAPGDLAIATPQPRRRRRGHSSPCTVFAMLLASIACGGEVTTDPDPEADNPGAVTDLGVVAVSQTSATIAWTGVGDGMGGSPDYLVRYATPPISWGSANGTEEIVTGVSVGGSGSHVWSGLAPANEYEFQIVAYRGALNAGAAFGDLSNVASAVTLSDSTDQEVGSVAITPSATGVEVGSSILLNATVLDTADEPMSAIVAWSSLDVDVASVGATGLVTGVAEGATGIVAETSGFADTASITVTDAGTGTRTVFFEEGFEDGGFSSRGWYDNTSLTTTTDESVGGNSSLLVQFNENATTPTFGGSARRLIDDTETIYVAYWVKFSANWEGSGRPYHPHDIQIISNLDDIYTGPRDTRLTTYIETTYEDGEIRAVLGMRDRLNIDTDNINVDLSDVTEDRAAAGCNGNTDGYPTGCFQNGSDWVNEKFWKASDGAITPNEWHYFEIYYALNSIDDGIGQTDGIAQFWVDGELVLDMDDVLFRTGLRADLRFSQFSFAPYIGDGSPVTQTMWVDDLVVADRR